MSIYPERRTMPSDTRYVTQWIQEIRLPGVTLRRTVTADPWVEERSDCYCCSCREEAGQDSACRNHGWYARRPRDVHQMSGQVGDDGRGVMPISVQDELARHREDAMNQAEMSPETELSSKCVLWKVQINSGDYGRAQRTLDRIHELQVLIHGRSTDRSG